MGDTTKPDLTNNETFVLQEWSEGRDNISIFTNHRSGLTEHALRTLQKSIFTKLKVKDRLSAVVKALRLELIEGPAIAGDFRPKIKPDLMAVGRCLRYHLNLKESAAKLSISVTEVRQRRQQLFDLLGTTTPAKAVAVLAKLGRFN